jgi:hypothetical protein
LASASSVAREGEIDAFSIFDSMPAEIPAAVPSSATVKSSDLRKRRTSAPIPSSSVRLTMSTGAKDPVRRSFSASLCGLVALRGGFGCERAGDLAMIQILSSFPTRNKGAS